jgi:hypothetical protein
MKMAAAVAVQPGHLLRWFCRPLCGLETFMFLQPGAYAQALRLRLLRRLKPVQSWLDH